MHEQVASHRSSLMVPHPGRTSNEITSRSSALPFRAGIKISVSPLRVFVVRLPTSLQHYSISWWLVLVAVVSPPAIRLLALLRLSKFRHREVHGKGVETSNIPAFTTYLFLPPPFSATTASHVSLPNYGFFHIYGKRSSTLRSLNFNQYYVCYSIHFSYSISL
jgi:hypothetical protein